MKAGARGLIQRQIPSLVRETSQFIRASMLRHIVGEVFVGLGIVAFWLALLVAMAGWILRRGGER